jgi:hypothetical protein
VTTLFGQAPANHLGHEYQFSFGSPAGAASPWRQDKPFPGSTRAAAEGACGGALSPGRIRFGHELTDLPAGRTWRPGPDPGQRRADSLHLLAASGSDSEEWAIHLNYPVDDPRARTRHTATPDRRAGLTSAIHDAQNLCWKIAAVFADGRGLDRVDEHAGWRGSSVMPRAIRRGRDR